MAGYSGNSMSNNAVEAYSEGRKPFSRITKEDILKYGVNESISFFRWYVKNYCDSSEYHHTSSKYNETWFYNIEECCNNFKRADIKKLKEKYKNRPKPKTDYIENNLYYARVEYSIGTFKGSRKYFNVYAIIYKCWAYIKDDYKKMVIKKKINGGHFDIKEKYQSRPAEMPQEIENEILKEIKILS